MGKKRVGIVIDSCPFSVIFSLGYDDGDGAVSGGDNDVKLVLNFGVGLK